jgi:hypothetical protein
LKNYQSRKGKFGVITGCHAVRNAQHVLEHNEFAGDIQGITGAFSICVLAAVESGDVDV